MSGVGAVEEQQITRGGASPLSLLYSSWSTERSN